MKMRNLYLVCILALCGNSNLIARSWYVHARQHDTLLVYSNHLYLDPVFFLNAENTIEYEIRPGKYTCKLDIISHSRNAELIRKDGKDIIRPLSLEKVHLTFAFTNTTTGVKDTIDRFYEVQPLGDPGIFSEGFMMI